MTSTAIQRAQLPNGVPVATRIGQGTAVEQSRAVAEVQAAIVVAQQCPRDVQGALVQMRESCAQPALANRSKFRFTRGGGTVSGPSVHLARELARCWGNVQYGVSELRRDDDHGESEMLAYAWDVQTNTRSSAVFIVPHKRDKKGGPERLTDMRDIYESNANAGARRVRECIFSILPPWFTEEAQERCEATLRDGGGVPLAKRIADLIANFVKLGLTQDQIETKLGRPVAKWTDQDVADLWVIGRSVQRGEVRKEDEFPVAAPTADAIKAQANRQAPPAAQDQPPTEQPPTPTDQPSTLPDESPVPKPTGSDERINQRQLTKLHTQLTTLRVGADEKHAVVGLILGQPIESTKDISKAEATTLIDSLETVCKDENPIAALDFWLTELREQAAAEPEGGE